jgi:outer membrane receptor protein involved in Fe transport
MKKTFLTAFALLSFMNFASQADDKPVVDTTSVRHLNLNEVQINASRVNAKMKDLPQKVEVVTRRMIEATPATDIGELLKKTAGVDIIQYPGVSSAVSMRGFAPSTSNKYNVILIDGRPSGTTNIATLDMSNVERVEILKGPFSAQYGSSAMAGVINIVTRESSNEIKGQASVAYGSFKTFNGNFSVGGALSESMDFDVSYNYQKQGEDYKIGKNNFFEKSDAEKILDPTTYGERMEHSQFERHNASVRLGFILDENWKINMNQSVFIANGIETPGSFWHIYGMNSKDINQYTTSAIIIGKMGIHNLSFSPFHTKEETTTFNSVYGNSESVHKNYGFILQDAFKVGEHSFAFGIDNKNDLYESNSWSLVGDAAAPYRPNYITKTTGVFGQINTKTLDGKLNLSVGARYDKIQFELKNSEFFSVENREEDYKVFTQNLGVKYEIIEGLSFHSAWGNAFLAPDAFQVAGEYTKGSTTYKGNANLDAERSNTFDIGFAYNNFVKGVKFDFTYFKTHHNDKIISKTIDPDGTEFSGDEYNSFVNADKADMDGIEIEASYDFGSLADYNYSLKVYANYTHLIDATVTQRVKQTDGTYKNVEGRMRYVRDNNANFGVEFDNFKGFTTRLNARYIGHRYEDNYMYEADYSNWPTVERKPINFNGKDVRAGLENESILRHPVYMVFDYSASYTFSDKYTVGLTVSNLLDENYTEKDGYNMPGRAFMAKFGVKF